MQKKQTAHNHHFEDHPNPNWHTHVACTICGFAMHRDYLKYALEQGATYLSKKDIAKLPR